MLHFFSTFYTKHDQQMEYDAYFNQKYGWLWIFHRGAVQTTRNISVHQQQLFLKAGLQISIQDFCVKCFLWMFQWDTVLSYSCYSMWWGQSLSAIDIIITLLETQCTAIYLLSDEYSSICFFPSIISPGETTVQTQMEPTPDFKEILKGLLQQLINSIFIQNFHK